MTPAAIGAAGVLTVFIIRGPGYQNPKSVAG
jgi:hypothetical protein